MLKKNELLDAIDDLETSPGTFQDCQKLATFYLLYDHLYGNYKPEIQPVEKVSIIADYGKSDFLKVVSGSDAKEVFMILDELMQTVKVLQPRLYEATLTMLQEV